MIKKVAQIILKWSAKIAIKRNGYKIVAITGSVGKTSTKKAVSLVLAEKYSVLAGEGEGYNTEIGVPLILIQKTVPKDKFGWIFLILFSPFLALKKRNYDFCVLEMGADKPGDIEYLTEIAKPDIAVVMNVFRVHLIEFKSIEDIAKEKEKILSKLSSGGVAILNADNEYTREMKSPSGIETITFGKKSTEVQVVKQEFDRKGSSNYFKVQNKNIVIRSSSLGEHILYVFACAIAVGISQKIEINQIIKALENFKPAKGRLNLIKGIKGSTIIDDSYNANPASMKNALDVLENIDAKRKIALLGSMNDLEDFEEEEHKKIGTHLGGKCDILVTVGEAAKKYLAPASVAAGMKSGSVHSFETSVQAGGFLKEFIQKGDVVLAKGSQNKIRVEKAVKMIMKNPEDAPNVLCRQGKEWEKRS
ncbi:MAG: UDP-N-acetylmuramoyl-tripeptide--D-alanyl-D-alanine ligase [bacterium]|nr:UDP-N-acetylmuramoyl-tripeptide--D-alanyl-D-alanine ligase [bacterium]